MSPCSPSSSRTARLLWTRKRNGRRPPSHRPQSFCLEEGGRRKQTEGCGHVTEQGAFSKITLHKDNVAAGGQADADIPAF